MYLKLLDPNSFDLIDVLSLYKSTIWETAYNTNESNFQIDCPMKYFKVVKKGMYVENSEDNEHIGVIKNIKKVKSKEGESLQIKGIMLEQELLHQRIAKGVITYADIYPTTVISNLIGLSFVDPAEVARKHDKIGEVVYTPDSEVPDMEKTSYSATYPNLEEEVYTLLQGIDMGFNARLNKETRKIDLYFYVGEDHTEGTENPIVLSLDRGTILDLTYETDSTQNITNVYCIGEDNVYVECEKKSPTGETLYPRIEKSVDVSGDVPWPTYTVEKPEEEGGQYFEYRKYSNPEFITNMDVWEKYDVERIETTETRYEYINTTPEIGLTPEEVSDILGGNQELAGSITVNGIGGIGVGSSLPSSSGLIKANSNIPKTKSRADSQEKQMIGYGFNLDQYLSEESKARLGISSKIQKSKSLLEELVDMEEQKSEPFRVVYSEGYRKPIRQNKIAVAKSFAASSPSKKKGGNVLERVDTVKDKNNSSGGKGTTTTDKGDLQGISVGADLWGALHNYEAVPYEVTVVTYEVKDFVEFVYVNKGQHPSNATKTIQGSVASGKVIMYENFEEVKVSVQDYKDALTKYGYQLLKTFTDSELVETNLYMMSNIVYGRDYKLGDIATAKDKDTGIVVDLRVTKAKQVWDDKGHNTTITLGTNVPQLTQRVRMISKGGI